MKYFVSALVFSLVCIVPFGSWYYLQSGLNYRKEALKELEPKGEFMVSGFDNSILKSKTTLIQVLPVEKDVLPEIFDQYQKSETYQVITSAQPSEEFDNWIQITKSTAAEISKAYNNTAFIIVDTAMMVRNTYPANMDGVRKMIEHTSIVLPRIKEIDIKMKK